MSQFVKCSPSNSFYFREGYPAKYQWDVYAQCGGKVSEKYPSSTFFFEVSPPGSFIRADSKISMEDAEFKAWNLYQKYKNCKLDHRDHSNLDRRDYNNGCSFCKECNSFISSDHSGLEPSVFCVKCNKPTYYTTLANGNWCCEECIQKIPENELSESYLIAKQRFRNIND